MGSSSQSNSAPAELPLPHVLLARYAYPIRVITLALSCYLVTLFSLRPPFAELLITPIWPVAGIAFGAIYLFGYWVWPGVFIGLLGAFAHALEYTSLDLSTSYLLIVGPAIVYTLEAMCAVWLLRRIIGEGEFLESPFNVIRLVLVTTVVAAASSSLVGVFQAVGTEQATDISGWLTLWLGNIGGCLLIAPAVVAIFRSYSIEWTPGLALEAASALLVIFMAAQILFAVWPPELLTRPVPLPIIMGLIWVAIRFGAREVGVALLIVAAVAIYATLLRTGPYLAESVTESMLLTLVFLIVTAAGFYSLSAALFQYRRATEALRDMNFNLEQRVRQRTDALAEVNQELKDYRDNLQNLVAERTADLELAKSEIESFSYSVSHDLRSPLRAIDGYSHALIEDYSDQLDDTARMYLERSRAASQRMGILIDDVLLLSRVTRHELDMNLVDLTRLAHEVIADMREADNDRDVVFEVAEQLRVQGDEHLLRIVLENLLGNAWKYSAKAMQSRIELGMERNNDEFVFFVRDNGIGFDTHYAHKLFNPFERLHDPGEFEGTGIGLATVARVMKRHGGRVWAEGKVNHGATFYFAFPERGTTTGPRKAVSIVDLE